MNEKESKFSLLAALIIFILYSCMCVFALVITVKSLTISNASTEIILESVPEITVEEVEVEIAEIESEVEAEVTQLAVITEKPQVHHSLLPERKKILLKQKAYAYMLDVEENVIYFERDPSLEVEKPVYNIQNNLSEWFAGNDNTSLLTLWKKNDEDGNLLLALRNQDETLVTFVYDRTLYDWISTDCKEWEHCSTYYSEITPENVIDVSFVGYREVSGNTYEGVQYQVMVLFNRDKSPDFNNTIRGVITQNNPIQYSCKNDVINRKLKANTKEERDDLEKCFRLALLTFANELIDEVPEDVVWAAPFRQGSGVWKYHEGTYYCHR